jgi:hypothetical protein
VSDPAAVLEFHEINEYIRHEIGVYFAWFSFFLTILFAAMGWSLKAALDTQGRVRPPAVHFCMLCLFTAQLALAIAATTTVMNDVVTSNERALQLLTMLVSHGGVIPGYSAITPVPIGYVGALALARWALVFNLLFWPLVAILVHRKWRTNQRLALPDTV